MNDEPREIPFPEYWSNGTMLYLRSALPSGHPEHPYNYVAKTFGVNPEDYGIEKPKHYLETCPSCGYRFESIYEKEKEN